MGGDDLPKKSYTVTVDEQIIAEFKAKCKAEDINQSMLITAFMRSYVNGRIKLELVNNQIVTMIKSKED